MIGRAAGLRLALLLFLACIRPHTPALSAPVGPPQERSGPLAEVRSRILRLVEEKTVPSLSLAVVKDGEMIWEEAFGWADVERKIPASPSTLYPIASATKPITATAVMILVERGLIDLDKPANAYLAETQLRAWEGDPAAATVRRILHHTSGLPMYWNFFYAGTSHGRPDLAAALQRYGRLVTVPGEYYNYSNLGYAVLERIIERAGGKPYPEFLTAEVFGPLNMTDAAIFATVPGGLPVAVKYSPERTVIPFCEMDTRGAGGVYATARDLVQFMRLHLGRLQPGQKAILKPDSVAVQQGSRDPRVRFSSYAFGWENGTRCGYPIVTHGGVMEGCRAHMAMIPSEGLGAAVLINGENVPTIQVCDWIFAALLPEYARRYRDAPPSGGPPPPPPPFRPTPGLVGTWEGTIQTHREVVPVRLIVEKDGRVELVRPDASGVPVRTFAPLRNPAVDRGVFVIHFPQAFSLPDARASSHRTVLRMRIRPDRLSGEADTMASDNGYFLPSFISLRRVQPEKRT